jgi:hypothetical protein
MSSEPDRIAVPTNGKRPHPVPATTPPPGSPSPSTPAARDMPGGISPRQLAVGFAVIAWLLVLVAGRARRRVRR